MTNSLFPSPLKRWQLIALIVGSLASAATICRFVIPPFFDLMMQERDQDMAELKAEVRSLRAIVAQSVEATQTRFEANERHTGYLRESVAAIRAELRVRFNSTDKPHVDAEFHTDRAIRRSLSRRSPASVPDFPDVVIEYEPETDADNLRKLAAKTDKIVEKTIETIPKGKPLDQVKLN